MTGGGGTLVEGFRKDRGREHKHVERGREREVVYNPRTAFPHGELLSGLGQASDKRDGS